MTLLDDVIEQASAGDASAMLRKLMIVAHRLGATELLAWVKSELNGYDDESSLPIYRGPMAVSVQAVITAPFGGQGTNTLSQHGVPDEFHELFQVQFWDPLAALESLARSEDTIGYPWDPAVVGLYNGWIDAGKVPFAEGWGVYSAHRSVAPSVLRGIVDVVRTKALEFALELQSEYPDAGEKDGPTIENPAVRETVTQITNNIYGTVNGLAQGGIVNQESTVQVGDIAGALDAARTFLADSSMVEFSKLLTDNGDEDAKRARLDRFARSVRAGSIGLVSGVGTNLAAEGLIKLASQFFGWA